MMKVIDHLDAAYAAKIQGYDSYAVKKLRLDNQKDVIEVQRKMAIQGLNDKAKEGAEASLRIDRSTALANLKEAWTAYDTALSGISRNGIPALQRRNKNIKLR